MSEVMRQWRKLNTEIISSGRVREIDFEQRWMLTLLLMGQDDDGYFEWEPAKVLPLVAGTTTWSLEKCEQLVGSLCDAGLLTRVECYVILYQGTKYNGQPRSDRNGRFYRSPDQRIRDGDPLTVSDSQVTTSDVLEERKKRGELDKSEIRGEEIPSSFDENTSNSNTLLEHLKNACERDLGRVEPSVSKMVNDFANQHPDLPVQWIDLAFEEAASYKKVSWPYVSAILESWVAQGHSGKEKKETPRGKSRKYSSNDAKRNRPGAGFEPLSGQRARVS